MLYHYSPGDAHIVVYHPYPLIINHSYAPSNVVEISDELPSSHNNICLEVHKEKSRIDSHISHRNT